MKRVMITGGTGAIGIALIEELIREKIYVTVVCHEGSQRITRIPCSPYVDIIQCNMERVKELPQYTEKEYDVFYHFGTFFLIYFIILISRIILYCICNIFVFFIIY